MAPLNLHARRYSQAAIVLGLVLFSAIPQGQEQSGKQEQIPAAPPRTIGLGATELPDRTAPPATRFHYPTGPDTFVPLPSTPQIYDTLLSKIRVVTLVNGLSRPFGLAFLPDGDILVTERTGTLRIVRNGVLDPRPIAGTPEVAARPYEGLMDIALHPKFAENRWLYLTYTKRGPNNATAIALARGRLEGHALKDVRDLYVVDQWSERKFGPTAGSRIAFDRNGLLYMTIACAFDTVERDGDAQKPTSALGKVLRLRDDGTPAPDNPFVGKSGYKPEIYTLGHRNALGLAMNQETGEMFEVENGPQGGDELNILRPGRNYGWPIVSEGRDYTGKYHHHEAPGMEAPFIDWNPSIGISGMAFYTGHTFPKWKGNVFVGALGFAHLERLTFNLKGELTGREWLLLDLKQRIRDVRQGPDGNLYLVTDAKYGALLRVEPAD